jgi:hypothetical protein
MQVALLNIEQVRLLFGRPLSESTTFNPVIDQYGNVLISEQEIEECDNPEFSWVKDLILVAYDSVKEIPNYTPPASNGYGVVIPSEFHWAFPIRLNGFIVELKDKAGVKYCEVSGLSWTEFISEFDKPQNNDYRLSVLPIWQYAMAQASIGNLITL